MFLLLENCALFVKHGMVYIANFEHVEDKNVKIFLVNGTNTVSLQDVKLHNLPENIEKWNNMYSFDVL